MTHDAPAKDIEDSIQSRFSVLHNHACLCYSAVLHCNSASGHSAYQEMLASHDAVNRMLT